MRQLSAAVINNLKARSFEPSRKINPKFWTRGPASVIEFLFEPYPQVPLDGSAEPLENWLSNKEGKSAF